MEAADVKSIEALQEMHAATCKFRTEAIDALVSVDLTIHHAHDWLAEQLVFWRAAVHKCEEEVFQAKQELAQRKYVGYDGKPPDTTVQVQNLKKAQARLAHAQEKVETVRSWQRKLPHAVSETYEGPSRQLSATLETEVPRGLALLEQRIEALDAYLKIVAPAAPPLEPASLSDSAAEKSP